MAEKYRTRGKGMTARPDYVRSDSPLETMRHLARIQKFEGSVAVAEEWAREILLNAGHGGDGLSVKQLIQTEHTAEEEDSDVDFAARIIKLILLTRVAIAEGDAEQAGSLGVRLGQEIALHDLKQEQEPTWESGRKTRETAKRGASIKRQNSERSDKELAKEFERRIKKSGLSPTALKIKIGQERGLAKNTSIDKINRGRKILSGKRANRTNE
jgi:hypothetical protein